MRMQPTLIAALALALSWGIGTAAAATFLSAPLLPEGESQLDCYLINISPKIREATIEVLDQDGDVLQSLQVRLAPEAEKVVAAKADKGPRYCRFAVEGNRSHFHASVLVRQQDIASRSPLSAQADMLP